MSFRQTLSYHTSINKFCSASDMSISLIGDSFVVFCWKVQNMSVMLLEEIMTVLEVFIENLKSFVVLACWITKTFY